MPGTFCDKHADMMMVQASIGECIRCGGYIHTTSFKLCDECAKSTKLCSVCVKSVVQGPAEKA